MNAIVSYSLFDAGYDQEFRKCLWGDIPVSVSRPRVGRLVTDQAVGNVTSYQVVIERLDTMPLTYCRNATHKMRNALTCDFLGYVVCPELRGHEWQGLVYLFNPANDRRCD